MDEKQQNEIIQQIKNILVSNIEAENSYYYGEPASPYIMGYNESANEIFNLIISPLLKEHSMKMTHYITSLKKQAVPGEYSIFNQMFAIIETQKPSSLSELNTLINTIEIDPDFLLEQFIHYNPNKKSSYTKSDLMQFIVSIHQQLQEHFTFSTQSKIVPPTNIEIPMPSVKPAKSVFIVNPQSEQDIAHNYSTLIFRINSIKEQINELEQDIHTFNNYHDGDLNTILNSLNSVLSIIPSYIKGE